MATSYTSLLGFALPVTGELSGSWGDTVNDSITQLAEDSIASTATASVTGGNWTLSTTGAGAANEARRAILIPTGTPGVSRNIVAPSQSKSYIVVNQSDAAVVLKGAATSGTTISAGKTSLCAWNGSDFVTVAGNLVDLTTDVTGTLPVANGGTRAATLTGLLTGNGTSAIAPAVSGTDIKTVNSISLLGSGNVVVGDVTLTGTETLTNKDLTSGTNTFPTPLATLTVTETLTNKTLTTPVITSISNSGTITVPTGTDTLVGRATTDTLTNKTLTAAIIDGGYSEEVFALGTTGSLALDPGNGSIQTCALTGNPTFTDSLAAGESIVLMLTNGSSYTVTFPTITWVTASGNSAPTLTAADTLVFWKVSTTLYGAYVGSGA